MTGSNNFLEEYDVRAEQVLGAPTFADVSFGVDNMARTARLNERA